MSPFLTPAEEIVIDLVLEWLGTSRINRTIEEYIAIAHRFPKIEAACSYVNERLKQIREADAPYVICDFRAGDISVRYRPFPTSVSRETVRTAMKKFGIFRLRELHPVDREKVPQRKAGDSLVS